MIEGSVDRPLSAIGLDYREREDLTVGAGRGYEEDVDMQDAGPSTAPLQGGSIAFLTDD